MLYSRIQIRVCGECVCELQTSRTESENTIIQRRDLPDANSINHSKEGTNLNTAGPATETGARTFRSRRAVSRLAIREGDHQTRPDSRSSVAHAARVQLSHRSWIRLNTLRHSRGTCQSRVGVRASASEQNRHPRQCVCWVQRWVVCGLTFEQVQVRWPGRCLCAVLSAQLGEPQSVLFPLSYSFT